jgi:O-antigen biosynthesis protein
LTSPAERRVKVAFASASDRLLPGFLERMATLAPELELFVVSEFRPPVGSWVPYRIDRGWLNNYRRCREALKGYRIAYAGIVLEPRAPYRRLRAIAMLLSPLRTLFFNENLDHFMLRPRGIATMVRHVMWRARDLVRSELRPGGRTYTWAWRLRHPRELRRPLFTLRARMAGRIACIQKRSVAVPAPGRTGVTLKAGLSVVIPTRNGRALLERVLPIVMRELGDRASEVIVVDNGSDDGSAAFLAQHYADIRVEVSDEALSFARAVNRGIKAAQFSHVCLLNNDMAPHAGFFGPLTDAFELVPDLFCATAQILFPAGQRREETGKAVFRWPLPAGPTEFPVRCIDPVEGENLTYVLYGSGGCSVYDREKLRELGGIGEVFTPAYVEDLDAGFRAWQRGWPTVFVAGSVVTHEHRTTTSRYYTEGDLDRALEINFLRFLARAVASSELFRCLWSYAVHRLTLRAAVQRHEPSFEALRAAAQAADWVEPAPVPVLPEELILGLTNGDVAVFPGRGELKPIRVLIASCYIPFPLSHGGAVRMYNLMRRAAAQCSQVLVTFVDELHTPAPELLEICAEIVQVRRVGRHARPDRGRPDVVEDFDSDAFRGALRQTVRKWAPAIAQLEFTQMAQYAADAAPAQTILVEHDVTIDLYEQLLANSDDFDTREQLQRWRGFETAAWRNVDCVVTMSEKDRRSVEGAKRVVALPNGVDLARFQPSDEPGQNRRLLFIGSFAHLPNLLALDFFLSEVYPLLGKNKPVLHVIAGARHEYHFDRHKSRLRFTLDHPGIELEGFVADVRPAYRKAAVVIAPLLASAGTNIKIMEAMAMGKAIVSTPAGVNGLELARGVDVLVETEAPDFASAVLRLLDDEGHRLQIGRSARATVDRLYGWDIIAAQQERTYQQLIRL